jgi:DNA-binding CsgD family transcriptional regulator
MTSMRVTSRLRVDRVRSLLRMVGEAHELRDGGECPRAHLVGGLGRVVGAEVSLFMTAVRPRMGHPVEFSETTEVGWPCERDRARLIAHVVENPDALSRAMLNVGAGRRRILNRRNVIEDRRWYKSELTRDVHRPIGLDDVLTASWARDVHDPVRVLVFKRRWGARPFGEEERDLLEVFLDACPLFDAASPSARMPKLAPREARTLAVLQRGRSEKETAHELGLSPSTVHGYVKDLYRKLGVSSRGELLTRYPARPAQARTTR